VSLPNAEIVVIHRSDGSGTSFVWSDYLSKVSPEWKGSVGSGTTVHWPVGVGAEYNEGVASTVQQTPNSLGYVEFIYALQHEISFAAVKNAAGQFIKADIASVTAAARSSSALSSALRGSITDPPGKASYPIATYTWIVLPTRFEDRNKGTVLAELLHWMLNSGQKSCSSLGYAPLPTDVAQRALRSLDQIIK
jgi:phosphate transport system substrate-binding protein